VILICDHLGARHNPASIVRSADALGAREVVLVGMPFINPRPACGSLRNVPVRLDADIASCFARLTREGYHIIALEPQRDLERDLFLDEVVLPERTAFVVGHEYHGVSFTPRDFPDVQWVAIRQFGRVPCMNVSTAAAIALFEYARQHKP